MLISSFYPSLNYGANQQNIRLTKIKKKKMNSNKKTKPKPNDIQTDNRSQK